MGGPYLVGPPGSSTWQLDRDAFVEAFLLRWPTGDVGMGPEGEPYHLIWSIRFYDSQGYTTSPYLDGSLDRMSQVFALYGIPSLAAQFITWFRSLIPEEPLAVMDDSANHVLTLLATTRVGEVEAFLTG